MAAEEQDLVIPREAPTLAHCSGGNETSATRRRAERSKKGTHDLGTCKLHWHIQVRWIHRRYLDKREERKRKERSAGCSTRKQDEIFKTDRQRLSNRKDRCCWFQCTSRRYHSFLAMLDKRFQLRRRSTSRCSTRWRKGRKRLQFGTCRLKSFETEEK